MTIELRILVAIANHGHGNREYLEKLIGEYRSLPFAVDIVVLSNIPKDLGNNVEVRVGVPTRNPWSLPFAHRELFSERRDDYELFIYSEDDTLVTEQNVRAFLDAQDQLASHEVPGFLRTEVGPDGTVYLSSIHSCFKWNPSSVCRRGEEVFAEFTNEHSACYMLTRDHLKRAIDSGGFLVAPHEGRHDMLCAAATDPYTQCGLRRLVCLSRIDDFLLPHLPNKYIGFMGLSRHLTQIQIDALMEILEDPEKGFSNFEVEPRVWRGHWARNCYESPDPRITDTLGRPGTSVISLGGGWGATEAELQERGAEVCVVPLDHVFGSMNTAAGVKAISAPLSEAFEHLKNERFDGLLIQDLLHLVDDPVTVLRQWRKLLLPEALVVVSVPNILDWREMRRGILRFDRNEQLNDFATSGVHPVNARLLRSWLDKTDLKEVFIERAFTNRRARYNNLTLGLLQDPLARKLIATARC